jgi:hypothetical protein
MLRPVPVAPENPMFVAKRLVLVVFAAFNDEAYRFVEVVFVPVAFDHSIEPYHVDVDPPVGHEVRQSPAMQRVPKLPSVA